MGYNPFRWYTKGKYRKKPLKSNTPLLLKIQNGDFEYSPYLLECKDEKKLSKSIMNILRTHIVKMNNLLNMKLT